MDLIYRNFGSTTEVDTRDNSDYITLVGVACRTDHEYRMGYGDYSWNERVAKGAFVNTLSAKPDVVLLVNHEGLPLARTTSDTMELSETDEGLEVKAVLDRSDPDVQAIVPKVKRGDLSQMSFAFRVIDQEWDDKMENRTIKEVTIDHGDVAVVTYPGNPATSFDLRSISLQKQNLLDLEEKSASIKHDSNPDAWGYDDEEFLNRVLDKMYY